MRPTPLTAAVVALSLACTKDRTQVALPDASSVAIGLSLNPADSGADVDEHEQEYLRALAAQQAEAAERLAAQADAATAEPSAVAPTPANRPITIDLAALLAQPADASAQANVATAGEDAAVDAVDVEAQRRAEAARAEAQHQTEEAARAEAQHQTEEAVRAEAERVAAARAAAERQRAEAARAEAERVAAARAESERRAEEQRRAAAARAEAERRAAEERRAEAARLSAEQRAERLRLAEQQRLAEAARVEAQRRAETARAAEAQRQAQARQQAEAQRRDEERRRAEELRRAEAARLAEQQRVAEAARLAEQQRIEAQHRAEQARLAEQQRQEQARLAEQHRAEEERLAAQRQAAQQRAAEQQRLAAEQRTAEATRRAEAARLAEAQRVERERLAEQQRHEAQQREAQRREAEARRVAEAARAAEAARRAEQERLAQAARAAETQRLADAQRRAEQERLAAEQRRVAQERAEAARSAERQRLAEQQRVAAARLAEQQRAAEEQRRQAEAARLAEERRVASARLAEQRRGEAQRAAERAEQQRIAAARLAAQQRAEQERAEAARRLAEQQRAEAARLAEERRVAEQRRVEAARAEAARRLAEQQRAEAARVEALRRATELQRAEVARAAEQRRVAEQQRLAEQQRAEQQRAEEARLAAQQRLAAATPTPATAVTPATSPTPRRATQGAWRRLPRVAIASARSLGRWDDPPDFDDDGLPDPIVAIEYVYGRTPCRAVASDHPCPTSAHDDVVGDGNNGSLVAGFVALFSGDAEGAGGDAGVPLAPPTDGRLLGTRRVWLSSTSSPHSRVSTFEFSEFGPGLIVRTILDADDGPAVTDTVDVLDVFTGLGLDRRAGAVVHHCSRVANHPPTRTATFSVEEPSLTPLVWRAITAHPYSGCATEVGTLDATLGQRFTGALQVQVLSTIPAGNHRQIALTIEQGVARPVGRGERNAAPWSDPLALGPVRVVDMARGCQFDRLRFERDGHRCSVVVPRSDDPLPGCETHTSPLDPSPPRPLWLHPHGDALLDGGVPAEPLHLVFARGGSLWETTLPLACGHEHRVQALPWRGGAVPSGVAVSPNGAMTLFAHGDDLWLFTRVRRAPYLLNAPGTALPRHEVRAVAFVNDTRLAAVFSGSVITFEVTVPATDDELPSSLRVDAAEIRRGLHPASPGR